MENFFLIGNWYLSIGFIFSFIIHYSIGSETINLSKYSFGDLIFAFIVLPLTWPIGVLLTLVKISKDIKKDDDLDI